MMSHAIVIADTGDESDAIRYTPTPASFVTTFSYAGANELLQLHNWYQQYHGFLATVVCVFGIVANILNIIVLTQKNMLSATNCILTGLAVSDGLTMTAYLPFALRFYVLYGLEANPERNSLAAIQYMWFFACFSVVAHSVSIWLTVVLAIFRYIIIDHPRHGATWCTVGRAKIAVLLVYVIIFIVCVPNFVTTTIIASRPLHPLDDCRNNSVEVVDVVSSSESHASYHVKANESQCSTKAADVLGKGVIWSVTLRQDNAVDNFVSSLNFWIQAVVVKLVPCCGLVVLSALLMRALREAEIRRQQLRGREGRCDRRSKVNSRTTRMLLLVVVLFLLSEFPQGVANLLNGALEGFFDEIYVSLGDLLDILALVNNSINFVLYCTMNKLFRDTFTRLFVVDCCRRTPETMTEIMRCTPIAADRNQDAAFPLRRVLGPAIIVAVGNGHGGSGIVVCSNL